jgi:uncharacterized membrane protein YphA (DoxX/SURF4 family)
MENDPAMQAIVSLSILFLGSLLGSAYAMRALGILNRPEDRSGLFRVMTRRMGSPNPPAAIPAIIFWALMNLGPAIYLVHGNPETPAAAIGAFFMVEAIWFASVAWDVARARVRRGHSQDSDRPV